MANFFNKRSRAQQHRRNKEKLYKELENSGCLSFLLLLPFRVFFFYLFFPYRAYIKSDVSPSGKVFHKIMTFLTYSLFAFIIGSTEFSEEDKNIEIGMAVFFSIIAIVALISIFKKKK